MKHIWLLIRMTRWRVLPTLLIFMLIGAAWAGVLNFYALLAGTIGVAASYACATSINDLADYKIDKINLPKDQDRPLVVGSADHQDLRIVATLAGVIAIVSGLLIGNSAAILMLISLFINVTYSMKPIQISHRPFLAPIYLPFGYVVVPFLVGTLTVAKDMKKLNLVFLLGLYLLFLGRIILKDFRDRKGDALGGKQTFLLQYGKNTTIIVSVSSVLLGYVLLITQTIPKVGVPSLVLAIFAIGNLTMLAKLASTSRVKEEQISIGVGAKLGNGMLLTLMALLVLKSESAQPTLILTTGLLFVMLYSFNFVMFLRHPENSVIAYKR